jgi:DNA-binding response OmpR family regulator
MSGTGHNQDGSSGTELRRRLATSGHSVPVIFITASDEEAVRRDALDSGCIAYLTKPFPARVLIEAIKTPANRRRLNWFPSTPRIPLGTLPVLPRARPHARNSCGR